MYLIKDLLMISAPIVAGIAVKIIEQTTFL